MPGTPIVGRPPAAGRAELGLVVTEVTPDVARLFGLKQMGGVVITLVQAGSQAEQAGVVRGELILQVGNTVIKGLSDYIRAIRKVRRGENVMLLVSSPSGTHRWVTLRKQ